jgi:hypothetical protein
LFIKISRYQIGFQLNLSKQFDPFGEIETYNTKIATKKHEKLEISKESRCNSTQTARALADEDINILDTTKVSTREYIFQVISITNISIFYFINLEKDTTPYFVKCRITKDLYKPHFKMRREPVKDGWHGWMFISCASIHIHVCIYLLGMCHNTRTSSSLVLPFDENVEYMMYKLLVSRSAADVFDSMPPNNDQTMQSYVA